MTGLKGAEFFLGSLKRSLRVYEWKEFDTLLHAIKWKGSGINESVGTLAAEWPTGGQSASKQRPQFYNPEEPNSANKKNEFKVDSPQESTDKN